MITIEEKLKLFTKIVYDKVEKENQRAVDNFNREYGNVIEQKKLEFTREVEEKTLQSQKNIEKEKLHILSKARIEASRIILGKRMEIFEEAIRDMLDYAVKFTETDEYRDIFLKEFKSAVLEMEGCPKLDIYLTQRDKEGLMDKILMLLGDKKAEFYIDDEIVGGFVMLDVEGSIRLDMSLHGRIQNARGYIGERLFEILQ